MGSNSGWPHALGCPEWVPPGAESREGVLGTLWWYPCPVVQYMQYTDMQILIIYIYIHANTH